jgi:ligand-binding sensor domain-containing protein/serine phosphatase RsbU (regulator of sigma subunit)
MKQKITLIIYLLFFRVLFLEAQSYSFRNYTIEDGLGQSYIYSISQNSKGYLYLTTGEGIYHYDGRTFTGITDKHESENFTTAHYIDSRDIVWIGHNQKGISYLKGNKFTRLTNPRLSAAKVTQIIEDKFRRLIVATNGSGLFMVDKNKNIVDILPGEILNVTSICFTNTNQIIAATPEGLYLISRDDKHNYTKMRKLMVLSEDIVRQVVPGKMAGTYWVLTEENGIYCLGNSNQSFNILCHLKKELQTENGLLYIYCDRNGVLWVSVVGEGLIKITNKSRWRGTGFEIKKLDKSNGLQSHHIQSIYQDNEGNMWFGTFGEGLIKKTAEKFSFYGVKENITHKDIYKIESDSSGYLWTASIGGIGCFDRSNNTFTFYPLNNKEEEVNTILSDNASRLWVGTGSSLYHFNISTKKFFNYSQKLGIKNVKYNCLLNDDGRILAGTTEGIYTFEANAPLYELSNTNSGLLHNNVISLFRDSRDRLWISSHGSAPYYIYNQKVFSFKDLSGVSSFKVNAVTEDFDHNIWIATDGDGVFMYNNEKFQMFTSQNGLLSNYCNGIIIDSENSVWVTHRTGLSEKRRSKPVFNPYSERSGLLFFENNINAVHKDLDNNIWFGTSSGIIHYNPANSQLNELFPKVFIERITFNNEEEEVRKNIEKSFGYYSIHIDYKSISLTEQSNITYKYRLLDIDSSWRSSMMPNVDFPKLGDGTYTFQVIACNEKTGLCSPAPASFSFSIKKPIYKTVWFYVILIAAITGITYFIIDLRTRRLQGIQHLLQLKVKQKTFLLQREKEAVEKIKVELENRNKDITDSINYARNIQTSILPPEEVMHELFGNNIFVLFKPKDIVSGDFYWAAALNVNNNNKKDLSLAAVIDCTGHGVPGAFLSIMANDFLKQSIIDKDVNNTNEILDFLNEEVSSHLNQSVSKNRMKDGMDIALVGVDKKKRKLYYSGANNPIYILRNKNGEVEVFILKATKQAIGLVGESVLKYDVQEFDLKEGDTIYLFSDGYADQFGGERNKKFTYKRFRETLIEAFWLPVNQQRDFLDSRLEAWKNGTEQTDDVCVLGIRV